jgi:hypothetical protein
MDNQQAERMIQLLEELRDGQRLQLERHAETMQRMEERLAEQRERSAKMANRNEQMFEQTGAALKRARPMIVVSLALTVICLTLLLYILVGHFVP